MIIIGVTGSIASGKTTFVQLFSRSKYPVFSADVEVKKLYKKKIVIKEIKKKFKIDTSKSLKKKISESIKRNSKYLKIIEDIIHPKIRNKMINFITNNNKKNIIILEIPLLFESKLINYFDIIVFVNSSKKRRENRYIKKGGNKKLFSILDKKQIKPGLKAKLSDHVVNNNKSLNILKKNAKILLDKYE